MARYRLGFAFLLAGAVLWPAWVQGQGVLVVVDSDQVVRLPRPPIIIWPPHHPPRHVIPRPEPPPASYKLSLIHI